MPVRVGGTRGVSVLNIVLWIVQVLLAAEFLYSAYLLFAGGHTERTFEQIGLGQWLRHTTGVLEAAGAIGLLIPGLTALAALGLAAVMVGASATELFILDNGSATLPLILLVVSLAVAVLRRDELTALLGRVRRR
ncbi:DoxX family protein [Amycolatopsis albispora]|uniref:DoxX family protein n=1 Tax=Amycolatopsis albispora TaxID=1804986 RepID=A0A344L577_9PSEU|nr:DoxX family protein [Amycolatopsis albispora]AXB43201.1 DoxX family protein [Amycolatopsis albispora]